METRKIKIFSEGDGQWACRFNFIDNIDVDVVITKVTFGYITNINVLRGEYKEGMVMNNALDQFDVLVKGKQSGAAGIIDRNHIKLQSNDRPEILTIYKFDFQLVYEGS